jgi:hypothetical protein
MTQCIVCKQEFKVTDITVTTPQGKVHVGFCEQHLSEMVISESTSQLESVELLV